MVGSTLAGILGAIGAPAIAQRSTAAWDAAGVNRLAPKSLGGHLLARKDTLRWVRGDRRHAYRGRIAHIGDVVDLEARRFAVLGLDQEGRGAIAVVGLDPQRGFTEERFEVLSGIRPLSGVYDAPRRDLYVYDPDRNALYCARLGPDGSPIRWERVCDAARLPVLDDGRSGGVWLRPHARGGVEVRSGATSLTPGARVHRGPEGWTVERPPRAAPAPMVEVVSPCPSQGPIHVWSTIPGDVVLQTDPPGVEIRLGKLKAKAERFDLPQGVRLDVRRRYRPVVRGTTTLVGKWFWPEHRVGTPIGLGRLTLRSFGPLVSQSFVGSPSFGALLEFGSTARQGTCEVVAWFRITKPNQPRPIVVRDSVAFLEPSHVTVMQMELAPDRAGYQAGVPFAIPGDEGLAGAILWSQAAVVGPGAGDLALSEVAGVAIRRGSLRRVDPALEREWERFRAKYATKSPDYVRALFRRVLDSRRRGR